MTRPTVALIYDFDGTLSPANMQEFGLIQTFGKDPALFWSRSNQLSQDNDASEILCYMKTMIDEARASGVHLTRESFRRFGSMVKLYPGVREWFGKINEYGRSKGLQIEHYINSSGLTEMIEGTEIYPEFKNVYACSFLYDQNDCAVWPANVVNYTTKTQFLFRINKGIEDDADNAAVNAFVPEEERRIPFARMLYLGDGLTDVPCMRLVKSFGGVAIAVHPKGRGKRQTAAQLLRDGRVNYVMEADYSAGGKLEQLVQCAIRGVALRHRMATLAGQNHRHRVPGGERGADA